jgi:hypothetical protein
MIAEFPEPNWKQQFIGHLEISSTAERLLELSSFEGSCSCIISQ